MRFTSLIVGGLLAVMATSVPASAAISPYAQDFEAMDPNDETALSGDNWLVGANVFGPAGTPPPLYNYFAFPAPNVTGGGPAFSGVATGESGAAQGANVLNVYNDYNNADHGNASGNRIEANVFRDIGVFDASDVGETYTFSFDVKQGNIAAPTTATGFMKVLQTSNSSFALLAIDSADTTSVGTSWASDSVSLTVDAGWVGETLQIGFTNTAANFNPSGVFYDNLSVGAASAVPEPGSFAVLAMTGVMSVIRRRRRTC